MSGGGDDLHLPPEIRSEIITRVPIKSMLRFRSGDGGALSSYDLPFSESRDIGDDLPDRFRGQRLIPVGSCDGLICLCDCRVDRSKEEAIAIYSFIIHNPAIRKIVELPSLSFVSGSHRISFCAFGFDSKASDYKVMLTLSEDSSEIEDEDEEIHVGFLFDLRNGAWRKFTPIVPDDNDNNYRSRMWCPKYLLNDAVHWAGYSGDNDKFVLSFDLSNETFRVTPMPGELNRSRRPLIMTSGGLIYALARNMFDPCRPAWVMKEYGVTESWTKVFTVDIPPQFRLALVLALIFRGAEAAEVLLRWRAPGELVAGK